MTFGMMNAPMTLQRLINSLFGPEFEPVVFDYLDDKGIVMNDLRQHLEWLEVVLKKVASARLIIKIAVTEIHITETCAPYTKNSHTQKLKKLYLFARKLMSVFPNQKTY